MAQPKSLPLEKNFFPDLGVRAKNHIYKDGEYEEVTYVFQEYPKSVGNVIVHSAEEEAQLTKAAKK